MKKTSFFLSLVIFLFFVTVFSGCGDDESPSSSLTLTIDGVDVKVTTVTGIMLFDEISGHESRTLNITGLTKDDDYLSIQLTNWDFQSPPTNGFVEKKYFNIFDGEDGLESADCLDVDDVTLCDAGMITFIPDAEEEIYTSAFDEDLAGFIDVTSSKNKKISGNFDVILTGFSNEVDLHVTGTFKNVGYVTQ